MKFKKSIAIIILIFILSGSLLFPTLSSTASSVDINTHWSWEAYQYLIDKGIIIENDMYQPDVKVNRAEFCKLIINALVKTGSISELVNPTGTVFNDVDSNMWYSSYIETAEINGIVNGAGDGNFYPLSDISRQEMAKIISLAYCKIENVDFNELKLDRTGLGLEHIYTDLNKAGQWARDYIYAVINSGMMVGNGDHTFNPSSNVTRAEAIVVTYRLIKLFPELPDDGLPIH